MSCTVCHRRKEKRFCLALHDRICPQCCGEQREITLDCPAECSYLQSARQHERTRPEDFPPDELFPKVDVTEQLIRDREALILGITNTIARTARSDRNLNDREVISALLALAKSYQTMVGSGLVYQEAVPGFIQQGLIESIRKLISDYRELEQQHLGYSRLKDSDVLRALVFVLRLAHSYTSGRPRARGFTDFVRAQFPDAAVSASGQADSRPRIILP